MRTVYSNGSYKIYEQQNKIGVDGGPDLLLPSAPHGGNNERRVGDDDCAKNRHIGSSSFVFCCTSVYKDKAAILQLY